MKAAPGGRPFKKGASGNPKGRPKGTRDRVPRAFKSALERAFHEFANKHPEEIVEAIRAGAAARPPRSFPYLQMLMHYVVGKPVEHVEHSGDPDKPLMPVQVVHIIEKTK